MMRYWKRSSRERVSFGRSGRVKELTWLWKDACRKRVSEEQGCGREWKWQWKQRKSLRRGRASCKRKGAQVTLMSNTSVHISAAATTGRLIIWKIKLRHLLECLILHNLMLLFQVVIHQRKLAIVHFVHHTIVLFLASINLHTHHNQTVLYSPSPT